MSARKGAEAAVEKIEKEIAKLQHERSGALANGMPVAEYDAQIRELRGQKTAIEEEQSERA